MHFDESIMDGPTDQLTDGTDSTDTPSYRDAKKSPKKIQRNEGKRGVK